MGNNALVNSLISIEDILKKDETHPLEVVRCEKCSLVQLKKPIDGQARPGDEVP